MLAVKASPNINFSLICVVDWEGGLNLTSSFKTSFLLVKLAVYSFNLRKKTGLVLIDFVQVRSPTLYLNI